jgi:hypothetical protein
MAIPALIGLVAPIVGKIVEKFITNKGDKDKALLEIEMELAKQEGELIKALVTSDVAQAEINKVEAESSSLFKSGWRPAIAWICVSGLAYSVFMPAVSWGLQLAGIAVPVLPEIGGETLTSLTFGILGLAGYRTYEKKNGVTK